jgi:hypothetical protein
MRHSACRTLPDEAIEPTSTPPGTSYLERCETLRELRSLHNAISAAQLARDGRLGDLARRGIVSRRDMARAFGIGWSGAA